MLLTGATGFIGARLVRKLVDLGASVDAVSRSEEAGERDGVRWHRVDLADLAHTGRLLEESAPDMIVHLASLVRGAPDIELVVPTLQNNLMSTVNLLVSGQRAGCERIVVTGTMVEPDPAAEGPTPNSPYSASKWASSGYARMFRALYDAPIVNLRVHMVYGPFQRDLRKLIPHVILSFLADRSPTLSSGMWDIDWIYLDDVVDAYVAALSTEATVGTADVGSGRLVSIREVVGKLAGLTGTRVEPRFGGIEDRPLETPHVADTAAALAALGWRPEVSLDEGLARTVEHYRNLWDSGEIPEGAF